VVEVGVGGDSVAAENDCVETIDVEAGGADNAVGSVDGIAGDKGTDDGTYVKSISEGEIGWVDSASIEGNAGNITDAEGKPCNVCCSCCLG
jgi:hypothetical protein